MNPYRIAIIGSKTYKSLHHVDALLDRLYDDQQARGRVYTIVSATEPASMVSRRPPAMDRVDECAIRYARGIGLQTMTSGRTRKDWEEFDGDPSIDKRLFIVDNADAVAAFWDLQSTNTADVLDCAMGLGKRVEIYRPDGSKVPPEFLGEAVRNARRGFLGGSHGRTASGCHRFSVPGNAGP